MRLFHLSCRTSGVVARAMVSITLAASVLFSSAPGYVAPLLADEAPVIFLDEWGEYGDESGQFFSPSGVAVGVDGKVYVADTSNDRVQVLDSDGTPLSAWGSEGAGPNQFNDPEGIAVDTAGNIYVADTDNHRVVILDDEGAVIHVLDGAEVGPEQFDYPYGVAVTPDGAKLYVADQNNHCVHCFTWVDSAYVFAFTIGDYDEWGTGPEEFNHPEGVAVGPDGSIYVADTGNHRVQQFDSSRTFVREYGGSAEGQFNQPSGVTVDADGNVYVADTGNGRIQKFTEDGEFLMMFGSGGSGNYRFSYPDDVAVTGDGDIVVADTGNDCLKVYGPAEFYEDPPRFLREWGSEGGGLTSPISIAIDDDGYVYVGSDAQRVQKFTGNGGFITTWGTPGSGDNQTFGPYGIAVDSEGSVYVSDSQNNRIHRLATNAITGDYESVERWGAPGEDLFYHPNGVAIDADDNVYVVDGGNHCVQMLDADSGEWSVFAGEKGTSGSSDNQFNGPRGIAVDLERGWVYVVDSQNVRIKKFDTGGTLLKTWGSYGPGPDEFNAPYGIAVDSEGNVYVSDHGDNCIQKFNSDGGFMTAWGTSGNENGEFNMPFGVAVHPNGDIYVTDYGNSRIQVFTYSELDTLEIGLQTGWNMVSVPVAPADASRAAVFPPAEVVAVYTWNPGSKSYEVPETIAPEVGYWVAVTENKTITVTGTPVTSWSDHPLFAGWNMVGSVRGDPVLVANIVDDPIDSLVRSAIYSWNPVGKSYTTAAQIEEGKGYWIAATQACDLTIAAVS